MPRLEFDFSRHFLCVWARVEYFLPFLATWTSQTNRHTRQNSVCQYLSNNWYLAIYYPYLISLPYPNNISAYLTKYSSKQYLYSTEISLNFHKFRTYLSIIFNLTIVLNIISSDIFYSYLRYMFGISQSYLKTYFMHSSDIYIYFFLSQAHEAYLAHFFGIFCTFHRYTLVKNQTYFRYI